MFLKGGKSIIICQTSGHQPVVIFLKTYDLDKEAQFKEWDRVSIMSLDMMQCM